MSLVVGNCGEDAELGVDVLVDCHDGCNIAAAVAVVRSRPHSDNRVLGEVVLK